MPLVTIDGRQVEFQPGQTIIRAALGVGIEIPYYCWHPRLSVAANCRMCLVEVEKAPKLLPACEAVCREGMVVQTQSQKVLEARSSVMEFLLINHPIDCPICDQAGECKLQDYYMKHDNSGTRFDETKVPKKKAVTLGPTVVLDEERCINCTRCVRFMSEVRHNPQLGQFDRGDRAIIGVFPGQPLDDPYSANVADICPVGALTNLDFRFKCRSWFLTKTDTICSGCARGCNVHADHYQNELQRLRPRDNDHVNQSWMCDDGRDTYKRVHDKETQIKEPYLLIDGKHQPITWEQAKSKLAEMLGSFVGQTDGTLGLALSSQLTTEGVAAFVELAEQVLQVDTYAILGLPDWPGDDFLRASDQNPNRGGAELVLEAYSIFDEGPELLAKALENGSVSTLIMVGSDYPLPGERWRKALDKAKRVIAFSTNWDESSRLADLVLPLASWAEQDGTFVNIQGRMQRVHRALMPIAWRKNAVEAAAIVADAVGAGGMWTLRSWTQAFNALKKRTNLLRDVKATELGPSGVMLESDKNGVSGELGAADKSPARNSRRGEAGLMVEILIYVVPIAAMLAVVLGLAGPLTWAERRQSAFIQDRIGPNRAAISIFGREVRAFGLFHPIADVIKLITKEDSINERADKFLYNIAPFIALFPALVTFAVIPLGPDIPLGEHGVLALQVARVPAGILYIFAMSSLAVFGVSLAGYASASKFAMLGGLRASAQMISYEVTMGMAILGIVMIFGSLEPYEIVLGQGQLLGGWLPKWGIFVQPLGFILFLTASIAENKRIPFDLAEGESEIVGYFVEYSGMKFGMFYMAEYIEVIVIAGVITTLFFGGWQVPWLYNDITVNGMSQVPLEHFWGFVVPWGYYLQVPSWLVLALEIGAFLLKLLFFCWFQLMIRWTLPRFRYDQVMELGWRKMLPLSLLNVVITAAVILAV